MIYASPSVAEANSRGAVLKPAEIALAEREIYKTFGDTVSAWDKGKSLLKFGDRDDLGTSRTTLAALGSGILNETYVTTNIITHFASSSGSDLLTMKVEGHTVVGTGTDSAFTFLVQEVTLVGQTKTALTTPLARVSRIYNSSATLWVGDIYVAQDVTFTSGVPQTATAIHIKVLAGEQQSLKAATTISNVDYWIVNGWLTEVDRKANAIVDFRLELRLAGGVFRPVAFTSVTQGTTVDIPFRPPLIVPSNADVRVTATASTTGVEAGSWVNGVLAIVI